MEFKYNKILKAVMAAATGSMALAVLYQGCGSGMDSSSNTNMCIAGSGAASIDKNYTVVPNQTTVSITYGRQTLDSMVACLGLGQPSTTALAEWTARDQTLSQYGNATDLSAAMMMAITAVAGDVCKDLVTKEAALPLASRSFFGNVDFTSQSSMAVSDVELSVTNLALACWQRLPTSDEKTMFDNAVTQLNGNVSTDALTICSAVLSSLSGIMQ